jgi:hypothetical protein
VNSGPANGNYGFWFPGKENDGAAGWQFTSAKAGSAWMGSSFPGGAMEPRGPWHYDGEIDLGFGGALRMAATIVTRDPIFDWTAYGGTLSVKGDTLSVIPRDGLRQRFAAILIDPKIKNAGVRFRLELDRDGFAPDQSIVTDKSFEKISFTLENRTGDVHDTGLWISLPTGNGCRVLQDGREVVIDSTRLGDYPLRARLKVSREPSRVEIIRQTPRM